MWVTIESLQIVTDLSAGSTEESKVYRKWDL